MSSTTNAANNTTVPDQGNNPERSRRRDAPLPPALDVSNPRLLQPWKGLVESGAVESLSITFTPFGEEVRVRVAGSDRELPPALALSRLRANGALNSQGRARRGAPVEQALPASSLTERDFQEGGNVPARVRSVSDKLGIKTIRGRILSVPELTIPIGDLTLEGWWSHATIRQKIRLLSDKKHFDKIFVGVGTPAGVATSMNNVPSPFQGALRAEEAGANKGASSSSTA